MSFILYNCDPAHAVGSVDGRTTTLELTQTHLCPECQAEFPSMDNLGDHLTTKHPILQPYLLFGGARVSHDWVIRQAMDASDLQIMNAKEVALGINGDQLRSISCEAFLQVLNRTRYGTLELQLRNRGACRRYVIHVLVPKQDDLRRIEDLFTEHLVRNDVSVSDVRHFDEILSVGGAAREYASALADYVYGILAKDSAGQTTLPFEEFPNKLKRSLDIVKAFKTPLAATITSSIRFNLNDFQSSWRPCGTPLLDNAFWFFRRRALEKSGGHFKSTDRQTKPLCPVDAVTHTILDTLDKPNPIPTLQNMTLRHDLSHEDRVKVCVLLADQSADLDPECVAACQAVLQFNPIFGRWANRTLGRFG